MEKHADQTPNQWHKDSKYWKFGLFYYNKEDKRLLVDKPNPNLGTTFNFAHRKSYLFLILIFSFFGCIVYLITQHK